MEDMLGGTAQWAQAQQQAIKTAAQKAAYSENCMAPAPPGEQARPYTLAEEASRRLQHHAEAHGKSLAAYEFLAKHPEFDEFVRLIRSGSIQI